MNGVGDCFLRPFCGAEGNPCLAHGERQVNKLFIRKLSAIPPRTLYVARPGIQAACPAPMDAGQSLRDFWNDEGHAS